MSCNKPRPITFLYSSIRCISQRQNRYFLQQNHLDIKTVTKKTSFGAVVVAQLVEQSLPTPEVRGSNKAIGKNLCWTFTVNCIEKTKIKKKEAGNGPFFKKLTSPATKVALRLTHLPIHCLVVGSDTDPALRMIHTRLRLMLVSAVDGWGWKIRYFSNFLHHTLSLKHQTQLMWMSLKWLNLW